MLDLIGALTLVTRGLRRRLNDVFVRLIQVQYPAGLIVGLLSEAHHNETRRHSSEIITRVSRRFVSRKICHTDLMTFTKRLRDGIRRGEITCSVRIWMRPRVIVGNRYRMEEGEIEVDSIQPIGFSDITPVLARKSGFLGIIDLLKVAK